MNSKYRPLPPLEETSVAFDPLRAADLARRTPLLLDADLTVRDALAALEASGAGAGVVGEPVRGRAAIATREALQEALRAKRPGQAVPVAAVATPVPCVSDRIALSELLALMANHKATHALLCDGDGDGDASHCRIIAHDEIVETLGELRSAAERAAAAMPAPRDLPR